MERLAMAELQIYTKILKLPDLTEFRICLVGNGPGAYRNRV